MTRRASPRATLAACGLAAALPLAATAQPPATPPSPKTVELLTHKCVGELAEDELTLFANGTVRLRERVGERATMLLAELERGETEAFVNRLLAIDLSEVESLRSGIDGAWIAQCSLSIALEGAPRFYRYGRFDALPHGLESVRVVLGEVETLARTRASHHALPEGYRPKTGDFVRRTDGELFEVIGFTSDGKGVELDGINQPVTIYVALAEFRAVFVALEDGNLLDLER